MKQETAPSATATLEPSAVWRFFNGIASVPRPSKQEERIRAHVLETAAGLGLAASEDAAGNIVISVPASRGCKDAPITVLQAHLDMVCEKNATTEHDFAREGIRPVVDVDGDGKPIVRADGTTLGADNGIGVALALAAATAPGLVHGPLELLFTVDEEDGMTGARALTADSFAGRRLLNLDSEEDDAVYVGCAGGCDTNLSWTLDMSPVGQDDTMYRIAVNGLRGGHSGGDIHENRGNANKLLVRTLLRANVANLRLASICGGSRRNAIPREATAIVCGGAGLGDSLASAARRVTGEAGRESNEKDARIQVQPAGRDAAARALSVTDTQRLLDALAAIPHGVLGMHAQVPGLVQTSNNLATIEQSRDGDEATTCVVVGTLTRSSSESRMDEALGQIACIGRLAGAEIRTANRYAGWEPDMDSPVLALARKVYARLFGEAPRVAAVHAGLECGIIGNRIGKVEMISIGPRIAGAHSPDERVWVESVQKSWKFLRALLEELGRT